MNHIKNYTKAKKAIRDYFAKTRKEERDIIELVEKTLADPKNKDPRGNYYRFPKGSSYSGNVCDPDMAKRAREYLATLSHKEELWLARLDRADKAGKLTDLNISLSWGRKGMYGCQCRCEVWATWFLSPKEGSESRYAKGPRTTGCGYCKVSTAISDGINALPPEALAAIDRLVIEGGERAWKEYAVERTPFPHLSFAGKGETTFTCLFPSVGRGKFEKGAYAFPQFRIDYQSTASGDRTYHIIAKSRLT